MISATVVDMPDQPDDAVEPEDAAGEVFTPDRADGDDERDLRDASAEVQDETEGDVMMPDTDQSDDLHRDPSRLAEEG